MRYAAEEQARWYSETWGSAQIVLAVLFFAFLLFGTSEGKLSLGLALLMFVVAVLQRAVFCPQIAAVGQAMDFVADPGSGLRAQMQVWSYGYTLAELSKWGVGLILARSLLWQRGGRSLDSREQVDAVYKANHRHIDG
jgi:hypothetical protein